MISPKDELPPHRYRLYGLTIASWILFSELEAAPVDAPVDAMIRLGEVPATLGGSEFEGACFQVKAGQLLIWINGVARYLVSGGSEILVQCEPDVPESDVRALLLCSPVGALLHQRGLLPLHGSAIATSRGAVVFVGNSGRGKSSLAAHFRERGFQILADDIAVITFDQAGRPLVQPGLPQFKLWPHALRELGKDPENLPRLRPELEKRTLAFRDSFCRRALPLVRIYALQSDNRIGDIRLESQPVLSRIRLLLEQTYRAQFLPGLGQQTTHFQSLSRVAAAVPVIRAIRPDDGKFRLAEFGDVLNEDFAK